MRSAQLLDNLNDAVRENPVAAGMIGVGLAWMAFGGSRMVVRNTQRIARAAKDTVDTATDAATGAIEPVAGVVDQVRKTAGEMSDAVSEGVKTTASKVGDAVRSGSATFNGGPDLSGDHRGSSRGRDLVEFLERQPLALAAIGVAVGAAIATAFPRTEAEDRLVGSAGETLRQTAKDAANTVGDRVVAAFDAATDEAVAQDLTPEAAKEAIRTGASKLKNVARAGLQATEDR